MIRCSILQAVLSNTSTSAAQLSSSIEVLVRRRTDDISSQISGGGSREVDPIDVAEQILPQSLSEAKLLTDILKAAADRLNLVRCLVSITVRPPIPPTLPSHG